jgi:hypothetical protein
MCKKYSLRPVQENGWSFSGQGSIILSRSNLGLIHLVFVHFTSPANHRPLFEFLLHVEGWMIVRVLEYIVWIVTVKSSAGRHMPAQK